jgi:hypothetical protein
MATIIILITAYEPMDKNGPTLSKLLYTLKYPESSLNSLLVFFFFQKKKQKARFCFAEYNFTQLSAKPTLGVWGRAPSKTLR